MSTNRTCVSIPSSGLCSVGEGRPQLVETGGCWIYKPTGQQPSTLPCRLLTRLNRETAVLNIS